MKIECSYHGIERTDAIESRIHTEIESALSRFADRLTRIEVHVGDHNGGKKGPNDKRCMMEGRPAGSQPVAVKAEGDDLYAVIADATSKLERVLARRFEKAEARG